MKGTERPARVAIVGGGCAALTAAFELTRPERGGRFDVTVYQMGFRLGGKGASGRGPAGRIEEHGLHLWMGFYENAFRVMRECYAELGRDPRACPLATFRDAFSPAPDVAVVDRSPHGAWESWVAHFPPGEGLPGDPLQKRNPFSVRAYLSQSAMLVGELLRSSLGIGAGTSGAWRPRTPEEVVGAAERLVHVGQLATSAVLLEAADLVRSAFDAVVPSIFQGERQAVLLRLLDALSAALRRQLAQVAAADHGLGRVWHVVDLILAILRGSVRYGLAVDPRGFDAIDEYDWIEWLRMNGAAEASLDSGFVRGIYDLAFAFEDGDVSRPRLAAGVALRGAMRMFFTYRGSLFWRMSAGMGDVVFAPLYEVLKRRGVKFEFFRRLADVKLADPMDAGDTPFVEELTFDVQAEVKSGDYQPLVDVHGVPCWPAKPDYAQLVAGERLEAEGVHFESPWEQRVVRRETRRVGRDFDFVVLGLSVSALPLAAKELPQRSARYRAMLDHVKSVPTQAFQVWLREDTRALGWQGPDVNLSGFVEPFDTWADMTHTARAEAWKVAPRNVSYFCSVLPDPGRAGEGMALLAHATVRDNAIRFLDGEVGALWPLAAPRGEGFRWELLAHEGAYGEQAPTPEGAHPFDTQYWTANVRPSDRYVLSLPGASRFRISPLDRTFDNLTVTGDWTETGLNTGCVESAVISGMLASHALSGFPALEDIVGYDHP